MLTAQNTLRVPVAPACSAPITPERLAYTQVYPRVTGGTSREVTVADIARGVRVHGARGHRTGYYYGDTLVAHENRY